MIIDIQVNSSKMSQLFVQLDLSFFVLPTKSSVCLWTEEYATSPFHNSRRRLMSKKPLFAPPAPRCKLADNFILHCRSSAPLPAAANTLIEMQKTTKFSQQFVNEIPFISCLISDINIKSRLSFIKFLNLYSFNSFPT